MVDVENDGLAFGLRGTRGATLVSRARGELSVVGHSDVHALARNTLRFAHQEQILSGRATNRPQDDKLHPRSLHCTRFETCRLRFRS